jgi:hypothetical protein
MYQVTATSVRMALATAGVYEPLVLSVSTKARSSGGRSTEATTINDTMTGRGGGRRGKTLSSAKSSSKNEVSKKRDTRYDVENAGPIVKKGAEKLLGKAISIVPPRTLSLNITAGARPEILSNVPPVTRITGSEASVSGITSAADQYNSYRFDEASAMKTYRKMMTLHLKDEMFRGLKFITSDAMLEFSRRSLSLCGYVCTKMRVPDYQWGEYWDLVKHTTKKMIEQQRTNVTSAVKKGFRGKQK